MTSSVRRTQFPEVRKRALLDAQSEAAHLLEAAHAHAEGIRQAAEEEYETWRAQAVREAEEQVANESRAAQLEALAREQRALQQLREATVPLVMRATEKLTRAAFDEQPERVRAVISEAIQHLRLASTLEVEVHADDLPWAQALATSTRPLSIRCVNDLARGECRVSSDVGSVDGRFATQLDALASALRGALHRHAHDTVTSPPARRTDS